MLHTQTKSKPDNLQDTIPTSHPYPSYLSLQIASIWQILNTPHETNHIIFNVLARVVSFSIKKGSSTTYCFEIADGSASMTVLYMALGGDAGPRWMDELKEG